MNYGTTTTSEPSLLSAQHPPGGQQQQQHSPTSGEEEQQPLTQNQTQGQQQQQQQQGQEEEEGTCTICCNKIFDCCFYYENNNNEDGQKQQEEEEQKKQQLPPPEKDRCCDAMKEKFSYALSLLLTAINLIFFFCLSLLLVMCIIDILISLLVQAALPPSNDFAWASSALICVIFPFSAAFVSTCADYSRWPVKFFLIHYHLDVVMRLSPPLPIIHQSDNRRVISSWVDFKESNSHARTEQDAKESRLRSRYQLVIAFIPFSIWFISLLTGFIGGPKHEWGTILFLSTGLLFVLFITVVEYDKSPTKEIKENESWWKMRPSESSSMRHILLHHRKFDLSIVGVTSALITSIIVWIKNPDVFQSGISGFGISISTQGIALIVLLVLRCVMSLAEDRVEEKKSKEKSSSALGGAGAGVGGGGADASAAAAAAAAAGGAGGVADSQATITIPASAAQSAVNTRADFKRLVNLVGLEAAQQQIGVSASAGGGSGMGGQQVFTSVSSASRTAFGNPSSVVPNATAASGAAAGGGGGVADEQQEAMEGSYDSASFSANGEEAEDDDDDENEGEQEGDNNNNNQEGTRQRKNKNSSSPRLSRKSHSKNRRSSSQVGEAMKSLAPAPSAPSASAAPSSPTTTNVNLGQQSSSSLASTASTKIKKMQEQFYCACCPVQFKNREQLAKFARNNKDFFLLAFEVLVLFIACVVLASSTSKPNAEESRYGHVPTDAEETWPAWLIFVSCSFSSFGLFLMKNQSDLNQNAEDSVVAPLLSTSESGALNAAGGGAGTGIGIGGTRNSGVGAANAFSSSDSGFLMTFGSGYRQELRKLQRKMRQDMDEETSLVFSYVPPRRPPEATYRISYFVVGFVAAVIVFSSIFSDKVHTDAHRIANVTDFNRKNVLPRYPICRATFPGGFSVVDVAAIAAAAANTNDEGNEELHFRTYFPNKTVAGRFPSATKQEQEEFYRLNENIKVSIYGPKRISPNNFIHLTYTEVEFPARNLTVIATHTSFHGFEALQELYLLSDAVALNFAIVLVPLPFSHRLLSAMIRVVSVFKFGTKSIPHHVFGRSKAILDDTAKDIHGNNDNYQHQHQVLLVGTSVGAFANHIAAAQLAGIEGKNYGERLKSVAFAGINAGRQTARFNFEIMDGDRVCTSVYAENDLQATLDLPMGMTQKVTNVDCDLRNSYCHSSSVLLNALSRDCRDPYGRRMNTTKF